MKKIMKYLAAFTVLMVLSFSASVLAQPSPGSNSGGDPVGGPPIGGGTAPIGGGIVLLITMAAGYGIKKAFDARNKFE
ncbi:hypothetical protein SDC9_14906 [bioreactor metagenome]|jgi:hypothetical protein|uniref:Uncharacterized protein n=1 Tax=bioreactor metagenome TaxID=1076179 RepID=A0A644TSD9_9ZZZZ|nr:hypothetical protein [Lentimicrobium sp.]MEA5108852.1 hypothetical protein [Lentimicrobium sp.]HCT70858.1 hypothetical protein [Bacteroidales bacterium]